MKEIRTVTTDLHQNSDVLLYFAEGYEAHARSARRTENPYRGRNDLACISWDAGWLNRQTKQLAQGLAAADRRAKNAIVQQLTRWIQMAESEALDPDYEQALRDFRDMLLGQGAYRKNKNQVDIVNPE